MMPAQGRPEGGARQGRGGGVLKGPGGLRSPDLAVRNRPHCPDCATGPASAGRAA